MAMEAELMIKHAKMLEQEAQQAKLKKKAHQ